MFLEQPLASPGYSNFQLYVSGMKSNCQGKNCCCPVSCLTADRASSAPWCQCDVSVISVWRQCDVSVISVWCQFDASKMSADRAPLLPIARWSQCDVSDRVAVAQFVKSPETWEMLIPPITKPWPNLLLLHLWWVPKLPHLPIAECIPAVADRE